MATFSWDGFGKLTAVLGKLADPDATPLMEEWERIIVEDNRKGVLAGTDKDGKSMDPVTYRPKGKAARVGARQRNNARGVFAGMGIHASGLNNNLTSSEYRKLNGPPLAPRRANSRVITNLFTQHGRDPGADNAWFAEGAWVEVEDTKGRPFLQYLFKKRDLRGVRPWGMKEAAKALQRWGARLLREMG
jgi:hypothetical protein